MLVFQKTALLQQKLIQTSFCMILLFRSAETTGNLFLNT